MGSEHVKRSKQLIKTSEIKEQYNAQKDLYKSLFIKLKEAKSQVIDEAAKHLHDKAFQKIDCRTCANCCKTAGPLLVQEDINRLSQHLDLSAGDFIQRYLEMDEDGDFVFVGKPCPFLQSDDLCSIYEIRPKACREYPHTNRKLFRDLEDIHLANAAICPAVQDVLENLDQLEGQGKLGAK